MEGQDPSSQTTLLILLGASLWPNSPEFQGSEAFAKAARSVKDYFLHHQLFGLPAENLLDLFDSDKSADELDVAIEQFLKQHLADMKARGSAGRDLLLYFIGHGGFAGDDHEYYLAIRRTRTGNPLASGLRVMSLAYTLKEQARHLRRIIILDCCFAAAAFSAFQAGPDQVALEKTIDAFRGGRKAEGFPTKGTTLFCSSDHKSPSLLLLDYSSTMFTKAFLDALAQGTPSQRGRLTLRDVKETAWDFLSEIQGAPRPVVNSPDQSEGDVADIPFFPNPAMKAAGAAQSRVVLSRQAEIISPSQRLTVPEPLPEPSMTGERSDAVGGRLIAPAGWDGAPPHEEGTPTLAPTARLADIGLTSIPTWPPNRSSQPDKTASPFGWPAQPHKTTPLQSTPSGQWHPRRSRRPGKGPLALIIMMLAVLLLLAGSSVLLFQLLALPTASIHFSPQVHLLSQVFQMTASTSVTGIDVGSRSILAKVFSESRSGSQTGPTTGQSTGQQVVSYSDVNSIASQIEPTLESQITHDVQSQLQALGATQISPIQFSLTSKEIVDPSIGSPSKTVTVTRTEQGRVGYFLNKDARTLARQLLLQQMQTFGADYQPVDSTIQIGQPQVSSRDQQVLIRIAAAGDTEYHFPQSQLLSIQNHIKGMTVNSARGFIAGQTGVEPSSVSIIFSSAGRNKIPAAGDRLPADAQHIQIGPNDLATLPSAPLPGVTPGSTPSAGGLPFFVTPTL